MSSIASLLLGGLLGGTVLFAVTAVAVRLPWIKRRPALASAMWLVVLARFVLPIPIGGGLSLEARLASAMGESVWVFPAPAVSASSTGVVSSASSFSFTSVALILWALVSTLMLLATLRASARTRRRLAGFEPASSATQERARQLASRFGLRRVPMVLKGASAPCSAGLFRPVIAIPEWLAARDLDAVLSHELAHVARRDHWWALVARAAEIALFFWPLVWVASRRFAAAREAACDSAGLEATRSSSQEFARTLISVSARLLGDKTSALAMGARPSQLGARVSALLAANARAGIGLLGGLVLVAQVAVGLPGSANDAEAATPWGECVVVPGMGSSIMSEFPDADRDGNGVLSRAEICAHQQRLREHVDDATAKEILSEAIAPMCVEELRCSDGGEASFY